MRLFKFFLPVAYFATLFMCSCSSSGSGQPMPEKRDTAISEVNAYSTLFFDSLALERFIANKQLPDSFDIWMRDFYNVRNYQYAWFDSAGISEQTLSFLNIQSNYISFSRDSSIYNPALQKLFERISESGSSPAVPDSARLDTELSLTLQFFRYANAAYRGNRNLDPHDLKWFIPRQRLDVLSLLKTATSSESATVTAYEPLNRQYALLREYLQKYSSIANRGGWPKIMMDGTKLELGDSAEAIPAIKRRLALTGDFTSDDSSRFFTDSLKQAVARFQNRFGLNADGVVGKGTLSTMNVPLNDRIKQVLINMERLKWVPAEPQSDYLLVNIPEFKLHVYESGNYAYNMRVVVGSKQHHTVIFMGNLNQVVFSPHWNVPPGILKNEVLPGIARDPNYLRRHNMEWFNGYVRQKPGPNNSLGLVKFLFPNNYNIYLHDTPSKSLFNETSRAFSHGCIRVSDPVKLAEWILRNDSTWTSQKIYDAMHSGKEQFVQVKRNIPVFIGYFTSWVDRQGQLNFRNDIYGHDREMGEKMFK